MLVSINWTYFFISFFLVFIRILFISFAFLLEESLDSTIFDFCKSYNPPPRRKLTLGRLCNHICNVFRDLGTCQWAYDLDSDRFFSTKTSHGSKSTSCGQQFLRQIGFQFSNKNGPKFSYSCSIHFWLTFLLSETSEGIAVQHSS